MVGRGVRLLFSDSDESDDDVLSVGPMRPKPEEDDSLSDIEPDVCDVPDVFPVRGETAAVEPLCFPVVVPTRPQGGCDPVLSLSRYKGGGGGGQGGG